MPCPPTITEDGLTSQPSNSYHRLLSVCLNTTDCCLSVSTPQTSVCLSQHHRRLSVCLNTTDCCLSADVEVWNHLIFHRNTFPGFGRGLEALDRERRAEGWRRVEEGGGGWCTEGWRRVEEGGGGWCLSVSLLTVNQRIKCQSDPSSSSLCPAGL